MLCSLGLWWRGASTLIHRMPHRRKLCSFQQQHFGILLQSIHDLYMGGLQWNHSRWRPRSECGMCRFLAFVYTACVVFWRSCTRLVSSSFSFLILIIIAFIQSTVRVIKHLSGLSVCVWLVCLCLGCLSVSRLSVCVWLVCLCLGCLSVSRLSVCVSVVCLSLTCVITQPKVHVSFNWWIDGF